MKHATTFMQRCYSFIRMPMKYTIFSIWQLSMYVNHDLNCVIVDWKKYTQVKMKKKKIKIMMILKRILFFSFESWNFHLVKLKSKSNSDMMTCFQHGANQQHLRSNDLSIQRATLVQLHPACWELLSISPRLGSGMPTDQCFQICKDLENISKGKWISTRF